jgi:hypothetical protein
MLTGVVICGCGDLSGSQVQVASGGRVCRTAAAAADPAAGVRPALGRKAGTSVDGHLAPDLASPELGAVDVDVGPPVAIASSTSARVSQPQRLPGSGAVKLPWTSPSVPIVPANRVTPTGPASSGPPQWRWTANAGLLKSFHFSSKATLVPSDSNLASPSPGVWTGWAALGLRSARR